MPNQTNDETNLEPNFVMGLDVPGLPILDRLNPVNFSLQSDMVWEFDLVSVHVTIDNKMVHKIACGTSTGN